MSDKEKPKTIAPVMTDREMEQVSLTTKEWLDREPKRKIRIRKDPDPKHPNYETVQINGYTFVIMKGVDVEVPETVHQILSEAGII